MFEKNLNISVLLDFYGDILSERQLEMLELYYNEDYSLSEIAEKYDISRQGVRSVLKKGEAILFDMEAKLHRVIQTLTFFFQLGLLGVQSINAFFSRRFFLLQLINFILLSNDDGYANENNSQ